MTTLPLVFLLAYIQRAYTDNHMCYRTTCETCSKPTWAGCGKHIEIALAGVPASDRCHCREEKAAAEEAAIKSASAKEIPAPTASQASRDDPMQVDTPVQQAASAPATLPAGIELKATLTGHTDRVWHIAPHPQRPLLATASADKTVRIYATNDYHLMGIVEGNHKRSIRCCDWKHGETKPVLATASFDSTAGIWDCVGDEETGEGEWECAGLLEGHENEVKCVAWSASGTLLATCSRDKSIWIWEAENYEDPECVSVMQEHSGDVKCVVWHPQEELLASGSYDDDIRLWRDDGDDWICCAILKGHDGTVWQLDFEGGNGLGQRLVSVSGDGTARIWRRTSDPAAKGKDPAALPSIIRPSMDQVWEEETQLPAKHEGDIYTVSWSKNTGRIATSGADGSVIIYKQRTDGSFPEQGMNTWDVVLTLENGHGVSEINHVTWGGLSADGKSELLYTAGDDCYIPVGPRSAFFLRKFISSTSSTEHLPLIPHHTDMTQVTRILRAAHARTPLIKFLGKRTHEKAEQTEPRVHPASPTGELPTSFQAYRAKAIQHGPLSTGKHAEASRGIVPARSQLESRYRYIAMSAEEMEAVETGGATLFA